MNNFGPHPVPSKLNELRGYPGKKKKRAGSEPSPAPLPQTDAPDYLDATAKLEWQRVVTELLALGMLTTLDTTMLSGYCIAYADFVRYTRFLQEHGDVMEAFGQLRMRPEHTARSAAFQVLLKCCAEFGFSPGARARMRVTTEPSLKTPTLSEILEGSDSIQ